MKRACRLWIERVSAAIGLGRRPEMPEGILAITQQQPEP